MAKKEKEETPNVNATQNRDIAQRLNFLYQASVYLQSIAPATNSGFHSNKGKHREEPKEVYDRKPTMMDVDVVPSKFLSGGPMAKKHRRKIGKKQTTSDLARNYVQCMRVVGQKTTVKIDPALKRSLCSTCSTTLVPGSSASIRVKHSPCHGQIVIYTCLYCKATKRVPAPPTSDSGSAALQLNLSDVPLPHGSVPRELALQTQPLPSASQNQGGTSTIWMKKPLKSRPLPLSARRDAGHVVFCGDERLDLDREGGFGVCFA